MDIPVLKDGDVVTVDGGRRQSFGSISGYTLKSEFHGRPAPAEEFHEMVSERLERATRLGHNYVWLNAQATIISNPPTIPDEIDHQLTDGQLVMIDSTYLEERGYWVVNRPGFMTGDNCRLTRPEGIYECQARNFPSGDDVWLKLLPGQVEENVSTWVGLGAGVIIVTRFPPNAYTLSGFSEGV